MGRTGMKLEGQGCTAGVEAQPPNPARPCAAVGRPDLQPAASTTAAAVQPPPPMDTEPNLDPQPGHNTGCNH